MFNEQQRHKVDAKTPITYESFTAWKERRKAAALEEDAKKKKEKEAAYRSQRAGGKSTVSFSGRELFEFNPEMAAGQDADDDGAMDADEYADRSASEHGDSDDERGPISGDDDSDEEDGGVEEVTKKVEDMEVNEDLFAGEEIDDDDDEDDE